LLFDYKKVADYHKEMGMIGLDYFDLDPAMQTKNKNLPSNFIKAVYIEMHKWLKDCLSINPPHFRDTLNPEDANYVLEEVLEDDGVESAPK
jgi:hypothetical protein